MVSTVARMKLIWRCMFSPRLYKIYFDGDREEMYRPVGVHRFGEKTLSMAKTAMNIGYYTSPLIFLYIVQRGFCTLDEARNLVRLVGGMSCIATTLFFIRAFGRSSCSKYVKFIDALDTSTDDKKAYMRTIRKYDFDFSAWPVSFTSDPEERRDGWLQNHPFSKCANTDLPFYQRIILQILAFISVHTFGIRLIFPGTIFLIQNLLWTPLCNGRTQLVEHHNGERAKVRTADGNDIDTMFIDKRRRSVRGHILVICCEGNSGFYEVGIMTTPIKAGFSTLGWNHPGFCGSTGMPYPDQEKRAIDAVIQYAINELHFAPENIIINGWSIGGYTAAYGAVNYPVKALILDATFDDLLPLALNQMPASWSRLVKEVVRSYVDLNISELLKNFDGPIQLVRRTDDEIICLKPGDTSTNRCNNLAMKLISQRHPRLFENGDNIKLLLNFVSISENQRVRAYENDITPNERTVLDVISLYMRDFTSNHCSPLTESHFDLIMDMLEIYPDVQQKFNE